MTIFYIVLDTNVLISSLWGGTPKKIIDLWKKSKLKLLVSDEIVSEYNVVLKRFQFPNEFYVEFLDVLSNSECTIRVNPHKNFYLIKDDPADNKFLDCAFKGHADYIISGDKHLKCLKKFEGIEILSPSLFIKKFGTL